MAKPGQTYGRRKDFRTNRALHQYYQSGQHQVRNTNLKTSWDCASTTDYLSEDLPML